MDRHSTSPNVRRVTEEVRAAARAMRHEGTEAERVLWQSLRAGRLDGLKFRRQHPVGRFVLDFYCPAHRLVVEVDGGIHDEQPERDLARTAELEVHGCRVIRFRNEEVLGDRSSVIDRIRSEIRNPSPRIGRGVASLSEPG